MNSHVHLLLGNAVEQVTTLETGSVNLCVTSPPYFKKRRYTDDAREIGWEENVNHYVTNLRNVFSEVKRVLADDGILFLNLADTYQNWQALGVPWRVALALQDDNWYLRSEIIWEKPNIRPENVRNRPTVSHEQLFLFAKSRGYYYDASAIEENSDPSQVAHNLKYAKTYDAHSSNAVNRQPNNVNDVGIHSRARTDGKRNKRSVWKISTTPGQFGYPSPMPLALARTCVLAGSAPGATVLDPFMGSGTTGVAALELRRSFIGVDLNANALELVRQRLGVSSTCPTVTRELVAGV
jgi:DNA modification methylase